MGYLFLLIALLAGVTKGYCGKKTSGSVQAPADAMLFNFVRMLFCVIISFFLILLQEGLGALRVESGAFLIMAGSGIATAVFVVSWILAVRKSAYMMLDVVLLLGVLIPMLLCSGLFGESIFLNQWAGMAILVLAAVIMCSYSARIKGKFTPASLGLLLLCGLGSGFSDFFQKNFAHAYPEGSAAVFNFYTYVICAAVLFLCFLCFRGKGPREEKSRSFAASLRPVLGYIALMAACLFLNSYFKLLAAGYLTATQLYPLSQGGSMILSTGMSAFFFKEKITRRCVLGLMLAFAALLIMNLM